MLSELTSDASRDSIVFEVVYPHPIARVWRALTEPAAIAQWLMENDFAPRLGHRFTLRDVPQPREWRGRGRWVVNERPRR